MATLRKSLGGRAYKMEEEILDARNFTNAQKRVKELQYTNL